jgi:hypothetical protein
MYGSLLPCPYTIIIIYTEGDTVYSTTACILIHYFNISHGSEPTRWAMLEYQSLILGFWTLSIVRNSITRKHNVSETGSVSALR